MNEQEKAVIEAVGKDADLQGTDLRGAYLQGTDLRGAYLQGADLQGADLRGAYLRDADLQDADLRGAHLRDADLQGAYLRDADLQDADLRGAYLQGACLRGADLQGADLQGAKNYLSSHDYFAEIVRRQKTDTFTLSEWGIIGQIVIHRLCWDTIKNRFGKKIMPVFKKLAKAGFEEWAEYYKSILKGGR